MLLSFDEIVVPPLGKAVQGSSSNRRYCYLITICPDFKSSQSNKCVDFFISLHINKRVKEDNCMLCTMGSKSIKPIAIFFLAG